MPWDSASWIRVCTSAARRHLQEALSIHQRQYGPWHEHVATVHSVLALVDARLGDYASARREQARALAGYMRVAGPHHPFVAVALTELARVYLEQGLPGQAVPLFERALAVQERNLGSDHRGVARTLAELGSAVMRAGRPPYSEARAMVGRALGIWQGLGAPDAPEFAAVLALSARIHADSGSTPRPVTSTNEPSYPREGVRHLASPLRGSTGGACTRDGRTWRACGSSERGIER